MRLHTSYQRLRAGRLHTSLVALATIGLLATSGCDDDPQMVGPGDVVFSPQATAASVFSLRFAPDNVALLQVELVAEALGFITPSASAVPARASAARGTGLVASFAPRLEERAVRAAVARRASGNQAGSGSVPLFPINFLGRTFAYDPLTGSYYADDLLPGAPPDGVRFLLYTLDPGSRLPAIPLTEIGFVDLTDESNATSTRIGVRAFDTTGSGTVPLADYFIDGAFGVTSASLAVNLLSTGLLSDQLGRFDFDLDELLELDDLTGATTVSIVHEVISDEGTDVTLAVEGTIASNGQSSLDWSLVIQRPGSTTIVDLTTLDDLQEGTISHNGRAEILVSGTVAEPLYVWTDGSAVSFAELEALDEILFAIDDILILADEVFLPLTEIFGLI